jgi:hypothetical protein
MLSLTLGHKWKESSATNFRDSSAKGAKIFIHTSQLRFISRHPVLIVILSMFPFHKELKTIAKGDISRSGAYFFGLKCFFYFRVDYASR